MEIGILLDNDIHNLIQVESFPPFFLLKLVNDLFHRSQNFSCKSSLSWYVIEVEGVKLLYLSSKISYPSLNWAVLVIKLLSLAFFMFRSVQVDRLYYSFSFGKTNHLFLFTTALFKGQSVKKELIQLATVSCGCS